MNQIPLTIFENGNFGKIRVIMIDDEPWFIGKDVAGALGYTNTRDALKKHVHEDDKNTVVIHDGTPGYPNKVVINESGLYSLIFNSKLESARKFKRWVTKEVLPSIRKTGQYEVAASISTRKLSAVNTSTKIVMKALTDAGVSDAIKLETLKELYSKAGVELPIETKAVEQSKKAKKIELMTANYNALKSIYRGKSIKQIDEDIIDIMDRDVPDKVKHVMMDMLMSIKYEHNIKFN